MRNKEGISALTVLCIAVVGLIYFAFADNENTSQTIEFSNNTRIINTYRNSNQKVSNIASNSMGMKNVSAAAKRNISRPEVYKLKSVTPTKTLKRNRRVNIENQTISIGTSTAYNMRSGRGESVESNVITSISIPRLNINNNHMSVPSEDMSAAPHMTRGRPNRPNSPGMYRGSIGSPLCLLLLILPYIVYIRSKK